MSYSKSPHCFLGRTVKHPLPRAK
uniref:Uncharacterized protein n=1 Tax=Anguilla anguilla TaxID=7936 RepID=A0A0E9QE79_ANGAN